MITLKYDYSGTFYVTMLHFVMISSMVNFSYIFAIV